MINVRVINYGKRGNSQRFLCRKCGKTFTQNYSKKLDSKALLISHLDGIPLRKISRETGKSPMTIFRLCNRELLKLPICSFVTSRFCDMSKFCGFLVFDGKFLSVKGYRKDIPILWGADYQTHDILHFVLAPSESYVACKNYFTSIKNLGYNLKYLVSDDNKAIRMAMEFVYPNAIFQLCLNHYKESIRRNLGIRTNEKYRKLFFEIDSLFTNRLDLVSFTWAIANLYKNYRNDSRCLFWIEDLMIRRKELTNYHQFEKAPNTTNLIESFNSQLEQRTKAIKGFQSFKSANLWLNGFVLRGRFSKFTDCRNNFKHLNGKRPLEMTKKDNLNLPNFI